MDFDAPHTAKNTTLIGWQHKMVMKINGWSYSEDIDLFPCPVQVQPAYILDLHDI